MDVGLFQVKDEWKFQELIAYVRDNPPGPDAPKIPETSGEDGGGQKQETI